MDNKICKKKSLTALVNINNLKITWISIVLNFIINAVEFLVIFDMFKESLEDNVFGSINGHFQMANCSARN